MADDQDRQLEMVQASLGKVLSRVRSKLTIHPVLDKSLAKELHDYMEGEKSYIREQKKAWKIRKGKKFDDTKHLEVTFPYYEILLDAQQAAVKLNTGTVKDRHEKLELILRTDSIDTSGLKGALEKYQMYCQVLSHKKLDFSESIDIDPLGISDKEEYERACAKVIFDVDRFASGLFGTKIITPANFDIKERDSHWYMGEINVGVVSTWPQLYMVIAHEGPLGHNTENLLARDSPYTHTFTHTSEGLALLGQTLVMNQFYKGGEQALTKIHYLYSRSTGDAAVAAAYHMIFVKGMSIAKAAQELVSGQFDKETCLSLAKEIAGLKRSPVTDNAYYFGSHIIGKAYSDSKEAIAGATTSEEAQAKMMTKVLKEMYIGHRPAKLVAKSAKLVVDDILAKNK